MRPDDKPTLLWWPEHGMGFYPVQNAASVYDAAYLAKYQGYAVTALGKKITEARLNLVRQFIQDEDELVDVGVGSGQFVFARAGGTSGYDINPHARRLLESAARWCDPYLGVGSVSCWDSLEHLACPSELLAKVRFNVFLSIPIFRDAEHVLKSRHFRKDEHYWYFTEAGLLAWFDRLGFSCRAVSDFETQLGREDIKSYVFRRVR